MNHSILAAASCIGVALLAASAKAGTVNFTLSGSGVSGQGTLTFTPGPGGADAITGITGVFSDANAGLNGEPAIVNAAITGLVPVNPIVPLPQNVTAPDFSKFAIANGVPSPPAFEASDSLSYDNTYYPGGSPVVCTDFPFSGGLLDVYGVMFKLDNGDVVGLWSNGIAPGPVTPAIYGAAVADATNTYDYVSDGVTLTAGGSSSVPLPPAAWAGLATLAGVGLLHRRAQRVTSRT